MAKIKLDIFTPYRHYLSEEVDFIHFKNDDTVLGILPNHAPLITSVEIGELILTINDEKKVYACGGGIFKIKDNVASLLLKSVERADEIDIDRAIKAKERAESRLAKKDAGLDVKRAELSLKRALVRISIKNYTNK